MKKLLLITILITFTFLSFSQINYHLNVGISTNNILTGDVGVIISNNIYWGIYGGTELNRGYHGTNYSSIDWNEYPEDFLTQGSYVTIYGLSIGYRLNRILIKGNIGYLNNYSYRNYFDKYYYKDYLGCYYKKKYISNEFDIGFDIGLIVSNRITVNIGSSMSQKCRLGIGILL